MTVYLSLYNLTWYITSAYYIMCYDIVRNNKYMKEELVGIKVMDFDLLFNSSYMHLALYAPMLVHCLVGW